MIPLEAVVVGSLAYLFYLLVKYWNHAIFTSNRSDLPGPKAKPLIGNLLDVMNTTDNMLEYGLELYQKHGIGWTITIPGIRMIDITRPDMLEHVQKTNFNNYAKGPVQASRMADILGTGIFASDGDRWFTQRKTSSHIFTASSFRGVITKSIKQHLDILVEVLDRTANGTTDVALNNIFFKFTLDSFCSMAFGQEMASLSSKEPAPFAVAFDYAQTHIDQRFRNPLWRIADKVTPAGWKMTAAKKTIDDYAYGVIDAREQSEKTGLGGDPNDLLSLYMGMRDDKGMPLTREQLRDSILNLIIAGRDTTAQALSWCFFRLISDPSYIDRLREEIKRVLGEGEVDYDNYRSLPLTLAIFNETLRLHPSVPKNGWTALNDDVLPGGLQIKKGEIVRWSDWQFGRDQSIWGTDAAEWKPERWLEQDEKGQLNCKRESSFKFHAFNAGARLCLGQNLATFEAISVIVALVRNYDLQFKPGYLDSVKMSGGAPLYTVSLTLPMKEDMLVRLTKR